MIFKVSTILTFSYVAIAPFADAWKILHLANFWLRLNVNTCEKLPGI